MKMTIEKFQKLYAISQMDLDELTRATLLVQSFTGMSEMQIDKLTPAKFNKLCLQITDAFKEMEKMNYLDKPKSIVRANGTWYFLNYDIAKPPMNAGRYVEVATFSKDVIGNLHFIMSTMANPMKLCWKGYKLAENVDHEKVANDMLKLDFSIAYHSAVFFYAVFSKSIQSLSNYFQSLTTEKDKIQEVIANFTKHSDGFTTAKWYQNLKISV
jgi:hypothetical protein